MTGEWIVYSETGKPIARYGQDEHAAKEAVRLCGTGITAHYKENK